MRRTLPAAILWLCITQSAFAAETYSVVECDESLDSGSTPAACLPRNQHHRHHEEADSTDTSSAIADSGTLPSGVSEETLSAYVQSHTETHSDDNLRLRRFMQWSGLFNTTSVAGHSRIIDWYNNHDDVLFEQPIAFVWETNDTKQWIPKDAEWQVIHERHAREMDRHKELDLILYGDSIFESILGTSVGHKIGRARGIPEVWSRYRGTSARKVLSITGDTTVDLMYRLLNGAMPLDVSVKKVVIQIGANNILKQWFQIPEDFEHRTSAIAESIIAVCDLILAGWPDTDIVLSAVLVGGVRGDWPGEKRNWTLPNRYSESATAINYILEDWVKHREDQRVSYVDCSHLYIIEDDEVTGGRTIDETLMPDTLHPNRFGFKMLLDQCFEPALYGDASVKAAAGIGR